MKVTPVITQCGNNKPKLRFYTDKGVKVPVSLVRKKDNKFYIKTKKQGGKVVSK